MFGCFAGDPTTTCLHHFLNCIHRKTT